MYMARIDPIEMARQIIAATVEVIWGIYHILIQFLVPGAPEALEIAIIAAGVLLVAVCVIARDYRNRY